MPRRVFGQKIKGLIFIKRGFQMTLCKDKQPKLEVECRDGNLRFYLLAVIITVQYCLVVSLIYEKTDVTRGDINNLRYRIQQLHSESRRELESIRYVVATLVQRFDAWKIQSVSPNEVRPKGIDRDPIPVDDKYDLHYWTCDDGWCKDVFQGMLGQYEIYECVFQKCRSLVGNPKHILFPDGATDAYTFWAIGDDEKGEFHSRRLGVRGRWWIPFSLHECNNFSCQQIALWTASNYTHHFK